jgi:hypothetical protein
MEFPRLVYMSAAVHQSVNSPTEYAAALKAGYYGSVPEALAKAHAAPVKPADASVMVYKGREKHKAADQAEADALIAGDGWFLTEADALRAVWPTAETVPSIMADLSKKSARDILAAGASYGVTFKEGTKVPEMLATIEARLLAGFDAATK